MKLVSSVVTQADASQQAGAAMARQTAQTIQMRAAVVSNCHTLALLILQAVNVTHNAVSVYICTLFYCIVTFNGVECL